MTKPVPVERLHKLPIDSPMIDDEEKLSKKDLATLRDLGFDIDDKESPVTISLPYGLHFNKHVACEKITEVNGTEQYSFYYNTGNERIEVLSCTFNKPLASRGKLIKVAKMQLDIAAEMLATRDHIEKHGIPLKLISMDKLAAALVSKQTAMAAEEPADLHQRPGYKLVSDFPAEVSILQVETVLKAAIKDVDSGKSRASRLGFRTGVNDDEVAASVVCGGFNIGRVKIKEGEKVFFPKGGSSALAHALVNSGIKIVAAPRAESKEGKGPAVPSKEGKAADPKAAAPKAADPKAVAPKDKDKDKEPERPRGWRAIFGGDSPDQQPAPKSAFIVVPSKVAGASREADSKESKDYFVRQHRRIANQPATPAAIGVEDAKDAKEEDKEWQTESNDRADKLYTFALDFEKEFGIKVRFFSNFSGVGYSVPKEHQEKFLKWLAERTDSPLHPQAANWFSFLYDVPIQSDADLRERLKEQLYNFYLPGSFFDPLAGKKVRNHPINACKAEQERSDTMPKDAAWRLFEEFAPYIYEPFKQLNLLPFKHVDSGNDRAITPEQRRRDLSTEGVMNVFPSRDEPGLFRVVIDKQRLDFYHFQMFKEVAFKLLIAEKNNNLNKIETKLEDLEKDFRKLSKEKQETSDDKSAKLIQLTKEMGVVLGHYENALNELIACIASKPARENLILAAAALKKVKERRSVTFVDRAKAVDWKKFYGAAPVSALSIPGRVENAKKRGNYDLEVKSRTHFDVDVEREIVIDMDASGSMSAEVNQVMNKAKTVVLVPGEDRIAMVKKFVRGLVEKNQGLANVTFTIRVYGWNFKVDGKEISESVHNLAHKVAATDQIAIDRMLRSVDSIVPKGNTPMLPLLMTLPARLPKQTPGKVTKMEHYVVGDGEDTSEISDLNHEIFFKVLKESGEPDVVIEALKKWFAMQPLEMRNDRYTPASVAKIEKYMADYERSTSTLQVRRPATAKRLIEFGDKETGYFPSIVMPAKKSDQVPLFVAILKEIGKQANEKGTYEGFYVAIGRTFKVPDGRADGKEDKDEIPLEDGQKRALADFELLARMGRREGSNVENLLLVPDSSMLVRRNEQLIVNLPSGKATERLFILDEDQITRVRKLWSHDADEKREPGVGIEIFPTVDSDSKAAKQSTMVELGMPKLTRYRIPHYVLQEFAAKGRALVLWKEISFGGKTYCDKTVIDPKVYLTDQAAPLEEQTEFGFLDLATQFKIPLNLERLQQYIFGADKGRPDIKKPAPSAESKGDAKEAAAPQNKPAAAVESVLSSELLRKYESYDQRAEVLIDDLTKVLAVLDNGKVIVTGDKEEIRARFRKAKQFCEDIRQEIKLAKEKAKIYDKLNPKLRDLEKLEAAQVALVEEIKNLNATKQKLENEQKAAEAAVENLPKEKEEKERAYREAWQKYAEDKLQLTPEEEQGIRAKVEAETKNNANKIRAEKTEKEKAKLIALKETEKAAIAQGKEKERRAAARKKGPFAAIEAKKEAAEIRNLRINDQKARFFLADVDIYLNNKASLERNKEEQKGFMASVYELAKCFDFSSEEIRDELLIKLSQAFALAKHLGILENLKGCIGPHSPLLELNANEKGNPERIKGLKKLCASGVYGKNRELYLLDAVNAHAKMSGLRRETKAGADSRYRFATADGFNAGEFIKHKHQSLRARSTKGLVPRALAENLRKQFTLYLMYWCEELLLYLATKGKVEGLPPLTKPLSDYSYEEAVELYRKTGPHLTKIANEYLPKSEKTGFPGGAEFCAFGEIAFFFDDLFKGLDKEKLTARIAGPEEVVVDETPIVPEDITDDEMKEITAEAEALVREALGDAKEITGENLGRAQADAIKAEIAKREAALLERARAEDEGIRTHLQGIDNVDKALKDAQTVLQQLTAVRKAAKEYEAKDIQRIKSQEPIDALKKDIEKLQADLSALSPPNINGVFLEEDQREPVKRARGADLLSALLPLLAVAIDDAAKMALSTGPEHVAGAVAGVAPQPLPVLAAISPGGPAISPLSQILQPGPVPAAQPLPSAPTVPFDEVGEIKLVPPNPAMPLPSFAFQPQALIPSLSGEPGAAPVALPQPSAPLSLVLQPGAVISPVIMPSAAAVVRPEPSAQAVDQGEVKHELSFNALFYQSKLKDKLATLPPHFRKVIARVCELSAIYLRAELNNMKLDHGIARLVCQQVQGVTSDKLKDLSAASPEEELIKRLFVVLNSPAKAPRDGLNKLPKGVGIWYEDAGKQLAIEDVFNKLPQKPEAFVTQHLQPKGVQIEGAPAATVISKPPLPIPTFV